MERGPSDRRPASDVYWARVTANDVDWFDRTTRPLDYLFYWVGRMVPWELIPDQFGSFTNTPGEEPDPWYTIVVGRHDGNESVGIESAGTRRAANRALAEVEALLAASTVDDFTGLYELGELR